MPVNFTTAARSASKASISSGNMGAKDKGASAWANVAIVAANMAPSFQYLFQFFIRHAQ